MLLSKEYVGYWPAKSQKLIAGGRIETKACLQKPKVHAPCWKSCRQDRINDGVRSFWKLFRGNAPYRSQLPGNVPQVKSELTRKYKAVL
jgi:hypothetical protein